MNEFLLCLVFGLHLLAVDLAMAGPLLAVWLEWRAARNGEPATDSLARRLAGWSLAALALGIGLGLVALALVPTGDALPYRRAIALLDARRWWFVGGELLFYFIAAGAYVGFWRQMKNWPICHRALAVVAATDLIYHFPPLFAVVSTLSLRPQLWGGPLDHALYWRLLLDGETISRVVHHWLAAAAVGATALMLLAIRHGRGLSGAQNEADGQNGCDRSRPADGTDSSRARIALTATAAQILVGVWVLVAMPAVVQRQVLGDDVLSSVLFGASLLMALGLMHHLTVVSLGDASRGAVIRAAGMMILTVLLMVAMFHRARHCAYVELAHGSGIRENSDSLRR